MKQLGGIHHVTAIAGDPQRNADFYVGLLGLRLVKRSVNQDDPGTYHLFYADALGNPGTDLTFFPWKDAPRGWQGNGQAVTVGLAIPDTALDFWNSRLARAGVEARRHPGRFGEEVIGFTDPDGLRLELVTGPTTGERSPWTPWREGPVAEEMAIRGFHRVTVQESGAEPTVGFLTEVLEFRLAAEADGVLRFETASGGSGAILDLLPRPGERRGRVAVGTVHHVAWRTPDDAAQHDWWERIGKVNATLSPIIDRFWFKSIYFREPGGVLFEIATDGPGFTADENPEELGSRLILPPWLEPARAQIEASLPPLRMPAAASIAGEARQ